MKDIIKIAWRNLWRNRRRTLITAASIFFAVFFAIVMRSFQLGSYDYMIHQSIESYSGYLQVQHTDYFEDPVIENSISLTPDLLEKIQSEPNVKVAVPRIESFALVSTGPLSKGVMIAGISPEKEKEMANPEHRLVRYRITDTVISLLKEHTAVSPELLEKLQLHNYSSYTSLAKMELELEMSEQDTTLLNLIAELSALPSCYLSEEDDGVLISDRLSKYLKILPGDSIILIGQGFQGMSAAGIFPVRGIVKLPSPDLDNKLIYMPLSAINTFLGLSGEITSIAINLKNPDDLKKTEHSLKQKIERDQITVRNWETLTPVLIQQIESDRVSGQIFVGVLYVIIFFGIFGTVTMMVSERMREFGVMVAIGMKRAKLAVIFLVEMLFMGLLGIAGGMLASVPVVLYGYYNPIKLTGSLAQSMIEMGFDPLMPLAWFGSYYYVQVVVVLIMVLLACISPFRTLLKLDAVTAMRK